jgi:hypothetical protein
MTTQHLTTTNFDIFWDDADAVATQGANALFACCENDLVRLSALIGTPAAKFGPDNRIQLTVSSAAAGGAAGTNSGY